MTVGNKPRGGTRRLWATGIILFVVVLLGGVTACGASPPPPHTAAAAKTAALRVPAPISELPVPPTAPSTAAGSCTPAVNPRGTGCVSPAWGALGSPGFIGDPRYVLLGVVFTGAPAAPNPASVYSGHQVLLVKTNGTTFPNGDAWKCLTCGVPAASEQGVDTSYFTYPPPHAFPGDRRVLVGNGVLDCGPYRVTDARCTPQNTHIYPIDLDGHPLGTTIGGGQTREWRLSPDGVHLGWSAEIQTQNVYDEFGFVGRLDFDAADQRYDLDKVTLLYNNSPAYEPYVVAHGNVLKFNPAGMVGEFRGWSSDGQATLGVQSYESDGIDAWATSLATGRSRPLTRHAEYTDPMFASPDGHWMINEEVVGSGRLEFISGMPGIPPITDQLPTTGYVSGIRNSGMRRYFLPFLVNTATGASEQINAGADPHWNAAADPVWLADNAAVVWAENLVTAPDCGNANPLPCPVSTEPGGRHSRVMIARFPSLPRHLSRPPAPVSDSVSWGTPYTVGQAFPTRTHLPAGTYTLPGAVSGKATVVITTDSANKLITKIQASYTHFSDDRTEVLNGTESAQRGSDSEISAVTWHENLNLSGAHTGSKVTSANGFTLSPLALNSDFQAVGTLTTTLDGHTYTQPANGD